MTEEIWTTRYRDREGIKEFTGTSDETVEWSVANVDHDFLLNDDFVLVDTPAFLAMLDDDEELALISFVGVADDVE